MVIFLILSTYFRNVQIISLYSQRLLVQIIHHLYWTTFFDCLVILCVLFLATYISFTVALLLYDYGYWMSFFPHATVDCALAMAGIGCCPNRSVVSCDGSIFRTVLRKNTKKKAIENKFHCECDRNIMKCSSEMLLEFTFSVACYFWIKLSL